VVELGQAPVVRQARGIRIAFHNWGRDGVIDAEKSRSKVIGTTSSLSLAKVPVGPVEL
jgi:hypothetical protein